MVKRWLCLVLAVCCAFCFAGCGEILEQLSEFTLPEDFTIPEIELPEDFTIPEIELPEGFTFPEIEIPEFTLPEDLTIPVFTEPVFTAPNIDVTVPTQPWLPTEPAWADTVPVEEHSELYIPGLDVEDVILYFNEVCLDAEFNIDGDPTKLQKWTEPIAYYVEGDYTEEDMAALYGFVDWLNAMDGFPGMYPTYEAWSSDMEIYFCSGEEIVEYLGDNFWGCDGGVTFWYENNEIYEEIICISCEIGQYTRNSVILEELYNGLGPVQDSSLREDSIIYAGYSEPQSLTEIDELILKLLYHPAMKCGMNREQCEVVIRELYY